MGLVIGGMLPSTEYTEQVEILAPGYNCKYRTIDNYPHKIVGVASGFTLGITVHKYNTDHILRFLMIYIAQPRSLILI